MHFKSRTWCLFGLLCLGIGGTIWYRGHQGKTSTGQSATVANAETRPWPGTPRPKAPVIANPNDHAVQSGILRNTPMPLADLIKSDHSILLRNAFVDTRGEEPSIPAHLKAGADAGSYIVQAKGAVNSSFREVITRAKAEIVAYIPNNAFLVTADMATAAALRNDASVQALLPFEPYYKLDRRLLPLAVSQEAMPAGAPLRVTLFPGTLDAGIDSVRRLGGKLLGEEPSPFGPQLLIRPTPTSLSALASLTMVQTIEPHVERVAANDLTRVQLGIALDGVTNKNYLDLTGTNVWVNVNDSIINASHGDLVGRVFGNTGASDAGGHGTFVAATLAGSGVRSTTVTTPPSGSVDGANFRGMAPAAKIFALPIAYSPDVSAHVTDTYLQETAAATNFLIFNRTNTLISNNSWNYRNASEYDTSAARYDAAVRDAAPGLQSPQQVLYVFPAGNDGFGTDDGLNGEPGTITSPGTAKNVITVGAIEHLRNIPDTYELYSTNLVDGTNEITTNIVRFIDPTDSDNQVAAYSSRGNVGVGIEGDFGRFKPDLVAPGTFVVSAKSSNLQYPTNPPHFFNMLSNMDQSIGEYRFDSGTTYAVPAISGLAALIQEFLEQKIPSQFRRSPSPALLKALLINGARSVNSIYNLQAQTIINYQGWGLPGLTNIIPNQMTTANESAWPVRFMEQSATNALATGETRNWDLTVGTNMMGTSLRITLVWTDPPGNPNAATKLVNDLDLVVTNLDSGLVFFGNNMANGGDFTIPTDTNTPPVLDAVNNVENVFINDPLTLGSKYSISVTAKRVNVNAVSDYLARTGNSNDVVQDFALVISSGDTSVTNAFTLTANPSSKILTNIVTPFPQLQTLTNGVPAMNQRAGAQAALVVTNGITNQWSFFVFTNTYNTNMAEDFSLTNGTNVAFVAFLPPQISRTRNLEADIDLYVSSDARLTNLNQNVLAAAQKSLTREGTEAVVYTNATIGQIFYVGVKSEDQQGGEFGLITISTDEPFETTDKFGRPVIKVFPASKFLPDGTPNRPSAAIGVAIGITPKLIQRMAVNTTLGHENFGDIFMGIYKFGRRAVPLNHFITFGTDPTFSIEGTNTFIFNDSGSPMQGLTGSVETEGPGNLNQFQGLPSNGAWIVQLIDNAATHTGRLLDASLIIEPLEGGRLDEDQISGTVDESPVCYFFDVPQNATNITITLKSTSAGNLEMYLRKDLPPSTGKFDQLGKHSLGQIQIVVDASSKPPLTPGRYFVCIENFGGTPANFTLNMDRSFDTSQDLAGNFFSTTGIEIIDDAVTSDSFMVASDRTVEDVRVGVRIDHPRVSDLVLHLVSPQGRRILLAENRGGGSTNGYGVGSLTNLSFAVFTEHTNRAQLPIKFAVPPFGRTNLPAAPLFQNGFEGAAAGSFTNGVVFDGWRVIGNSALVVSDRGFAPEGNKFVALCDGGITTNIPTVIGKEYVLRYLSRAPLDLFSTGVRADRLALAPGSIDQHYVLEKSGPTNIPQPLVVVSLTNRPAGWRPNNPNNEPRWLGLAELETNRVAGQYIYRTIFDLCGYDPTQSKITGTWNADDVGQLVLNGNPIGGLAGPSSGAVINQSTGFLPRINTLDFFTTNNTGAIGLFTDLTLAKKPLNAQTNISPAGTITIGPENESFFGTSGWKTNFVIFVADSTTTFLTVNANARGLWLDNFSVQESGNVYYQPEESLDLLKGERAAGLWKLEMWDTKAGPLTTTTPQLLAWTLDIDFGFTTPPAVLLTNNIAFTGTLKTNEVMYFIVDTCPSTTTAINILTGAVGRVELLIDRHGFPTGDPETDDFVPRQNTATNGVLRTVITRNNPAPATLIPGERYYLAVRNVNRLITNTFGLTVSVDGNCDDSNNSPNQDISAGTPLSSVASSGLSRVFHFNVPSGAAGALFELYNLTGNADLLLRRGSPPTESAYDRISASSGLTPEQIVLRQAGDSPDIGGDWYAGVLNRESQDVGFTIRALDSQQGEILSSGQALHISAVANVNQNGSVTLAWGSVPGEKYQVQISNDLRNWQPLTTLTASGSATVFTDNVTPGASQKRFYRIVQVP